MEDTMSAKNANKENESPELKEELTEDESSELSGGNYPMLAIQEDELSGLFGGGASRQFKVKDDGIEMPSLDVIE